MAVTIARADPLAGVPNKGQVAAKIGVLLDGSASYSDRRDAAGWLRGAVTVMKTNPKQAKAVNYINDLLKENRYPEDAGD